MNKSDSIKNLAEALNKAQAVFTPAPENANNPHLRNKYADLGSIIETVKPVLAKYGLSVSQLVEGHAGEIGVSNVLMHVSGEWLESYVSMPIADAKGINPAQAAGSIVSYLRRYSLAAMLGIYAGGDDDANGGNQPTAKPAQAHTPAQALPPSPKANGKTAPAVSLEDAMNETASDGTKYGTFTTEQLGHRKLGLEKALKAPLQSPEQLEEYTRKLAAVKVLLAHHASQGLPQNI